VKNVAALKITNRKSDRLENGTWHMIQWKILTIGNWIDGYTSGRSNMLHHKMTQMPRMGITFDVKTT